MADNEHRYTVHMSSVGNPDFGQDSEKPLSPPATAKVRWLMDAKRICAGYIARHDLGGGNWTGGQVFDATGRHVADIAYNGRLHAPSGLGRAA